MRMGLTMGHEDGTDHAGSSELQMGMGMKLAVYNLLGQDMRLGDGLLVLLLYRQLSSSSKCSFSVVKNSTA